MSMFRKTALTSAIIGAGLVSTAGAAFAGDAPHEGHHGHHGSSHSTSNTTDNTCVNEAGGSVDNGGAALLGGITGSQGALGLNLGCDILNGSLNGNGSNNTFSSGSEEPDVPIQDTDAGTSEGASTFAAPSSVPQGVTSTPIQG